LLLSEANPEGPEGPVGMPMADAHGKMQAMQRIDEAF
jgi:hypothetical protein